MNRPVLTTMNCAGMALTMTSFRGCPTWDAREVGCAIGHDRFVDVVAAAGLIDGVEVFRDGDRVLLSESGLHLSLARSATEPAARLRRLLVLALHADPDPTDATLDRCLYRDRTLAYLIRHGALTPGEVALTIGERDARPATASALLVHLLSAIDSGLRDGLLRLEREFTWIQEDGLALHLASALPCLVGSGGLRMARLEVLRALRAAADLHPGLVRARNARASFGRRRERRRVVVLDWTFAARVLAGEDACR